MTLKSSLQTLGHVLWPFNEQSLQPFRQEHAFISVRSEWHIQICISLHLALSFTVTYTGRHADRHTGRQIGKQADLQIRGLTAEIPRTTRAEYAKRE